MKIEKVGDVLTQKADKVAEAILFFCQVALTFFARAKHFLNRDSVWCRLLLDQERETERRQICPEAYQCQVLTFQTLEGFLFRKTSISHIQQFKNKLKPPTLL